MKRKIKSRSVLYAFLDSQGVLETGTNKDIKNAKEQYWRDYRNQCKKIKRQENKSFEIFFNIKEAGIIKREAEKNNTSVTDYIKQSALTNNKGVVDRVQIGKLRQVLFSNYNAISNLYEQNKIPEQLGNQLLEQMLKMEKEVLAFIHSKR